MKSFKDLTRHLKRPPSDSTGVDIGDSAVKIVRLRSSGSEITVVGASIEERTGSTLIIPPRLRARSGAIATSGSASVIKLLTFPGSIDANFEKQLPKNLGLTNGDDYRISYHIITEGQGRADSRVLAVALQKNEAEAAMQHFASGLPAPKSLEVSPLATLSAFERCYVNENKSKALGLIDFGTTTTTLSLFNKNELVLLRRFDFGSQAVLDRLTTALHVDSETAVGILADSAFDISELMKELMLSVANNLVVSRDFVERRESCSNIALYATGGLALSKAAMQSLEQVMNMEIPLWDPFSGFQLAPQALDNEADTQRWRFSAAIGAALATLEDS